MVAEKELHDLLDKMVERSRKMNADKDDETMYEYHVREMDDLRDEFSRKLASCSKEFQYLFLTGTLKSTWKKLKGDTLAVRAILLDELSKF